MQFTKMHGIGNDYVYVNGFEETVEQPEELAQVIADRHFGVGGDGLILLLPADKDVEADCRMRMFNSDGSESEMCGNGVRCVCKLAHDRGVVKANPMKIQTGAGVLTLAYTLDDEGMVSEVTVDMGEPIYVAEQVPVLPKHMKETDEPHTFVLEFLDTGELFTATMVSMGNPHATIFVPDVHAIDLERIGPKLENHPAFPNRMNIHFVQHHSPDEVTMRTWERGSGITLACGTGASAVCVSGVLDGRNDKKILAHLPGGDLTLDWREDGHLYMTGTATEVFRGDWPE
ncbi:Diaminopimelate epimerase [Poriferisphaera corsica]|uniref:Diaminopimelate epimerase n=1 Tax=Poriferisphaera corsica TaxID=2528020 RepID=A0A517YVG8_9BACT|nr:diaminopimelate epimerase [Poriferisphaera corsica]QDU34219.1 Diaminopimelate epimerase [Poriferisphaera corsica]